MTGEVLGPLETGSAALLAVRPEDGSFTGPEALSALLKTTLQRAGVELGAWDITMLRWLAGLDVQTVATIAGWVGRANGEPRASLAAFDEVTRILAAFDWEHGDRQLALEAIERVVLTGGQQEDDDQEDDETYACSTCGAPACTTCGAPIGMFTGLAGWRHFRGDGTADNPVELYDAGHEATFAQGPGGAS